MSMPSSLKCRADICIPTRAEKMENTSTSEVVGFTLKYVSSPVATTRSLRVIIGAAAGVRAAAAAAAADEVSAAALLLVARGGAGLGLTVAAAAAVGGAADGTLRLRDKLAPGELLMASS